MLFTQKSKMTPDLAHGLPSHRILESVKSSKIKGFGLRSLRENQFQMLRLFFICWIYVENVLVFVNKYTYQKGVDRFSQKYH